MGGNVTRRLGRKVEVVLVLVAVGLASSCVSATKDANPALKRGRDGDDKKVLLDLSQIVRSKDDLPSGVSSAEQERLRNVKLNPRNYKFSCAIAPLTIDFRRVEKDPELGEPLENFSERPPLSRPVEDDEARKAAELPPEDRLAGVPLRPAEERFAQTAAPSSSTPLSTPDQPAPPRPDSSAPKEGARPPETPAEEPEPPPRRVGALPGTTRRQFAESDSPAPVGSDSVAPTGTDATAEVATAPVVRTSSDELKKISQYEGMNFRIDANGFRKRMADVFREYLVFEHVDEIDYTSDQKTLESLFQQAEANGDDFLLVATLKRNKVSYLGTDFGGAFTDDVLWVLFWFPSEFFGFIPRESFEADVELQVKLYDVRS